MAVEIERKFLVRRGLWTPSAIGDPIRQGYIASSPGRTIRVRLRGDRAFLTIKGPTTGLSRLEFEYPIPADDAAVMLRDLCDVVLEKHRHVERHHGHVWEIDVFHGDSEGLIVAEVELASEQEVVTLPAWVDREVSGDYRYSNAWLARHPFSTWPDATS